MAHVVNSWICYPISPFAFPNINDSWVKWLDFRWQWRPAAVAVVHCVYGCIDCLLIEDFKRIIMSFQRISWSISIKQLVSNFFHVEIFLLFYFIFFIDLPISTVITLLFFNFFYLVLIVWFLHSCFDYDYNLYNTQLWESVERESLLQIVSFDDYSKECLKGFVCCKSVRISKRERKKIRNTWPRLTSTC